VLSLFGTTPPSTDSNVVPPPVRLRTGRAAQNNGMAYDFVLAHPSKYSFYRHRITFGALTHQPRASPLMALSLFLMA